MAGLGSGGAGRLGEERQGQFRRRHSRPAEVRRRLARRRIASEVDREVDPNVKASALHGIRRGAEPAREATRRQIKAQTLGRFREHLAILEFPDASSRAA
jgi:hypothetical protein